MNRRLLELLLGCGLFAAADYAKAVGTLAGTTITNQVTVNFNVSATPQVPVLSNTATFVVDRRINFTLVKDDLTYVAAVPNQTNVLTRYTLVNLGNGIQDFRLAVAQQASGATDAFGGLDNSNLSSTAVSVDVNGNGTYETATDTRTFVDQLSPDNSVVIFIRGRFALTATNGQIAGINLTATARAAGAVATLGGAITQATGVDVAGTEQIVFGDGIGTGTGDINRDAKISALSAYRVVTAVISAAKSSIVVSDPVNATINPKRIPGATIEFSIAVTNSGSASATALTVNDTLATNLTYVTNSILVDGIVEDDNATGTDETDPNGGRYTSGTRQVRGVISILPPGTTKTVKFRARIN